tara:strand:+ start:117 stop:803 length:687 start_codon:yes stop_codon:yes gene_type:complete
MKHDIVAIIPARGGSKRIRDKNLYPLLKKPILQHSIEQAKKSKLLKDVFVSSDNNDILNFAKQNNCKTIIRPLNLADDFSSSEDALIHASEFIENNYFKINSIMMLQCTSPIRKSYDIDKAINLFYESKATSLISVVENKRFIWEQSKNKLYSLNYDYKNRPRTQNVNKQYMETGSIYITEKEYLLKTRNRLGGKIIPFIMNYITNFELDNIEDIKIIEWAMKEYYSN